MNRVPSGPRIDLIEALKEVSIRFKQSPAKGRTMLLEKYLNKRKFDITSEPKGGISPKNGPLRFVVQKHQASHLHYDFRLEMEGVLKSWAIPKGPSLNPADKRLAMMTEDHPMDYRTFEGTIPPNQYGAGEVIVWDEGTYWPVGTKERSQAEKILLEGLRRGSLKFCLNGKKLKGLYTLFRLNRGGREAWLLVKAKDKHATQADITKDIRSVLSKASLSNTRTQKQHIFEVKPPQSILSKKARKQTPIATKAKLTNLDKPYWPEEGLLKGDLLRYYHEMAPIILPYLKDRPQSLHRHPNGIKGNSFYQKNITADPPDFVKTIDIDLESEERTIRSIVCNNRDTLLYLANLGCIELNPWSSRINHMDKPDFAVIDLDPGKISFDEVVRTAMLTHKILEGLGIPSYPKTSGKTGLHVFIPLAAKYDFHQVRLFVQIIVTLIHQELPDITSLERHPDKRKTKIYLDYLQNNIGQTLAAPYSVRPWPGATVSAPLEWKEVKKGLSPADFTMTNIFKRLEKKGDLWKPVLGAGVNLRAFLSQGEALRDSWKPKSGFTLLPLHPHHG